MEMREVPGSTPGSSNASRCEDLDTTRGIVSQFGRVQPRDGILTARSPGKQSSTGRAPASQLFFALPAPAHPPRAPARSFSRPNRGPPDLYRLVFTFLHGCDVSGGPTGGATTAVESCYTRPVPQRPADAPQSGFAGGKPLDSPFSLHTRPFRHIWDRRAVRRYGGGMDVFRTLACLHLEAALRPPQPACRSPARG